MKKVCKKIVSSVLVVSLLITGGSLSFASEQDPVEMFGGTGLSEAGTQPPEEKTEITALTGIAATEEAAFEARMLSQEEALEAHSLLWASFPKDENGWPSSYPEDYAGCYIDEASDLIILLVNPTEKSKAAYKELCGGSDRVKFKAAQYSMKELEACEDTAMELYESGYDLVSWGVNEKNNRYRIRVKTENYFSAKSQLNRSNNLSPIVIEPTDTSIEPTATNLYGGQKCVTSKGNGTIGIGGTYNGKDAILIAGHCVSSNGDSVYNSANTKLGTVVRRQYNLWQSGDYAIVQLTSSFKSTNKIWPSFAGAGIISVEGVNPNLPVGTAIRKYGISSGYSYGTIEDMVTSAIYPDCTINNLVSAIMTTGSSSAAVLDGDSGGPVCRVITGGKFMLTGTVSGRDRDEVSTNRYRMYYNDISFPTGVGFKVKTS